MDKLDTSNAENHFYATQSIRREVTDLIWDMDPKFRKIISEKYDQLPNLSIKKSDLGKTDFDTEFEKDKKLEVKLVIPESEKDNPDNIRILVTDNERVERTTPQISEEVITDDQLKQYKTLPRTYRGIGKGETGMVYKDTEAKPVGWVSIVEDERNKSAYIAFIGVSVNSEQNSYGTAIIKSLQSKYKHLSLQC